MRSMIFARTVSACLAAAGWIAVAAAPASAQSPANESAAQKTATKMLNMPRCAYSVQISTTFLLSATDAFVTPSSLMFALINSTAR